MSLPLLGARDGCGDPIVGISQAIRRAVDLATRFAPTELPVLLVGPTGTGKELLARLIHARSGRPGPLVDVNTAALPREMVESLLFGHRRGAFTGAISTQAGLFAAAADGTLFLDELASLPVEGQAKLLRVLESGEVRILGETVNRKVRCRFVGAVQEDIDERIDRREFRADLYQRLAGVVIRLPALRDRSEDIIPLARAFADEFEAWLDAGAEAPLREYAWPGNVRELKAAVRRAALLAMGEEISAPVMAEAIALGAPLRTTSKAVRALSGEAHQAAEICRAHDWDIALAARAMGVSRATLYRRLKSLGVEVARMRSSKKPLTLVRVETA